MSIYRTIGPLVLSLQVQYGNIRNVWHGLTLEMLASNESLGLIKSQTV